MTPVHDKGVLAPQRLLYVGDFNGDTEYKLPAPSPSPSWQAYREHLLGLTLKYTSSL